MTENRIFTELLTDMTRYDALEIHGVRNFADNSGAPHIDCDTCCEICDEDPEFFSVYAHLVEGGVECIGDFDLHADAFAAALALATSQSPFFPVDDHAHRAQVNRIVRMLRPAQPEYCDRCGDPLGLDHNCDG